MVKGSKNVALPSKSVSRINTSYCFQEDPSEARLTKNNAERLGLQKSRRQSCKADESTITANIGDMYNANNKQD